MDPKEPPSCSMPCLQFAHNCNLKSFFLVTALSHYDCDDSIGDFADNKIQYNYFA